MRLQKNKDRKRNIIINLSAVGVYLLWAAYYTREVWW